MSTDATERPFALAGDCFPAARQVATGGSRVQDWHHLEHRAEPHAEPFSWPKIPTAPSPTTDAEPVARLPVANGESMPADQEVGSRVQEWRQSPAGLSKFERLRRAAAAESGQSPQ